MANEITLSIAMQVVNGNYRDLIQPGQLRIDQATIGRGGHVQTIGTSEEVIDLGDVVTNGYAALRNLDEDNYVTYGPENAGAMVIFGKLKAGEPAVLRIAPTVVIRAQANTAPVKLDVRVYED